MCTPGQTKSADISVVFSQGCSNFKFCFHLIQADDEAGLCLLPVEECTYCDTEWLQQGIQSMTYEAEGITFIHSDVPLSTAKALNVPSLMSRMLDADELPVTDFGQYFGQTLTS